MDAAPEQLLRIISCKCTTSCATAGCSCKKAGLLCSAVCKRCVGIACENSSQPDTNEADTDDEDRSDLPLLSAPKVHEKVVSMDTDYDDDDNADEVPSAPKRSKVIVA